MKEPHGLVTTTTGKFLKTGLSEREIDELREIFRLVDKDGGGTISKDELQILMKTLGIRASAAELDAMVDEIDAQKTGEIDFPSFVAAMSRKVATTVTAYQLKKAFKMFDSYYGGKPGHVTYDQLINILCYQAKANFAVDDAAYMVNQVVPSLTQAGSLDYMQFMELYKEAWDDTPQGRTSGSSPL
ncbi:hypothetical protein SeLEV6574_g04875 [Synchytrium endobioticum]|nr:hypothetical protein SeLEV6574_g04875 [Synchytrium endobioticum]